MLPSAVDSELRRWGYDPDDVLPVWAKRGLLMEDTRQGTRARAARWMGKTVRLYALRASDDASAETVEESPATDGSHWH